MSREHSAGQYIEYAQDRIRETCLDAELSALRECITVEIVSAQDHRRAERDLDAQESMALWAMIMTAISVAGVGLTGLGIYLVWGTLSETRIAARAAQDAVAVTRDIGEAQVRCYIYANVAEINTDTDNMDIVFRNFGNSPGSVSYVDCYVLVYDPYAYKQIWSQKFWSDGWTVAPQDAFNERFRLPRGRGRFLNDMIERDGISVHVQGKFQSVDVFKRVQTHAIDITLSDGVRRQ